MTKILIWTFADMGVDDVAKFANDNQLKPGYFQIIPLSEHDYVRVVYLSVQI